MGKPIIWTNQATAQLHQAFLDLLEESQSLETTLRVINAIYESVSILTTDSEIYKLDALKKTTKAT